jgi:RimJ/RimL family protein N-acetyltransferase
MLFCTDRLVVRRWRPQDLDVLFAVYGDALAMRRVGDGKPLDRARCADWMRVTRINYEQRGYGMFAVERKTEPGAIGFCGLVHPGGQFEPEVKYAYRRSQWGRGFATEALRGLLAHAVDAHGIRMVVATTAPENTASQRVLLKAGLVREDPWIHDDGVLTQRFRWRAEPSC